MNKVTLNDISQAKGRRKITMLTAYDYPMARAVDRAGIDIVLVGDSVANVVLGLDSTKDMTMDQMVYHAKAARRGVARALLVGDMPYLAYQQEPAQCVYNARRFIDEAGCDGVKIEWFDRCVETSRAIVQAGITVMGHIGLTPQTADKLGGFKVQARDAAAAKKLIEQALELEAAGCFSIVLECVPDRVAQAVTKKVRIPTIGIGAGPQCDGQVLVTHDLLGCYDRHTPKFVKRYLNAMGLMELAFGRFKAEVGEGRFPDKEHSYGMNEDEAKKLENGDQADGS